jgi:hypothetical protein
VGRSSSSKIQEIILASDVEELKVKEETGATI